MPSFTPSAGCASAIVVDPMLPCLVLCKGDDDTIPSSSSKRPDDVYIHSRSLGVHLHNMIYMHIFIQTRF